MRFSDVTSPPSGWEVMQLQNRMDTLAYSRSLPGVWGEPEQGFVQFYAQQIGLNVNTVDGDTVIEQVLPVIDSDIAVAQSGGLRSAPAGGGVVTGTPIVISGQAGAGVQSDPNAGLLWLVGAVVGAKLLRFF